MQFRCAGSNSTKPMRWRLWIINVNSSHATGLTKYARSQLLCTAMLRSPRSILKGGKSYDMTLQQSMVSITVNGYGCGWDSTAWNSIESNGLATGNHITINPVATHCRCQRQIQPRTEKKLQQDNMYVTYNIVISKFTICFYLLLSP